MTDEKAKVKKKMMNYSQVRLSLQQPRRYTPNFPLFPSLPLP